MTMFEVDLVASLREYTPLTDLVEDRIHPVRAPWQQTYPYLTYQISTENVNSLCYTYRGTRYDVTLDVWAKTYTDAASVRRALLDLVRSVNDARFRTRHLDGSSDGYEDDTKVYRVSVTVVHWYIEE